MKILDYAIPRTMEEASRLVREESGTVVGGMLWLRLQKGRTLPLAVDLSRLGLDRIEQTEDGIRVGATVTLRQMETDSRLGAYSHDAFARALSPIIGVQLRNLATVGGSIAGRFGFSDPACLAAALGASACYDRHGRIPVARLMRDENGIQEDILTHLLLPKTPPLACAYASQRNSKTDFPILTACGVLREDGLTLAVGARPGRVLTYRYPPDTDLASGEARRALARDLAQKTPFADNARASAAYRRTLCEVWIRRTLEAVYAQTRKGR